MFELCIINVAFFSPNKKRLFTIHEHDAVESEGKIKNKKKVNFIDD